jgi:hypothetical protein
MASCKECIETKELLKFFKTPDMYLKFIPAIFAKFPKIPKILENF